MDRPLIVGVDGSDSSLRAIDWAVAEATRHDLPLRLVHSSMGERHEEPSRGTGSSSSGARATAEQIIESAAQRVADRAPGLPVAMELVSADPGLALLRGGEKAWAIVVGTGGRGEATGMPLGSTGLEVAGYAACPVVVVRDGLPEAGRAFHRVTLGVAAPWESSAAIEFAFREAEVRDARLRALHVWRAVPSGVASSGAAGSAHAALSRRADEAERELDAALLATSQAYPKVAVDSRAMEGRAHHELLETSGTSDLLVVGARRPRGSGGMQLGTVNHTVLHHALCPVVVVPQRP